MLSKYIKKLLLVSFLAMGLVALVGCSGSGSAGEESDTTLLDEDNTQNTPPTAYDLNITTKENSLVEFTLNAKDKDSNTINYKILTKPQHGTLSGKAPKLTYTPKPNFIGNDSFIYIANDGEANSNKAVVNITVVAVKHTNKAPVANDDNATTSEDKSVTIDILENDIDSDGVIDKNSIQLSKTPTHGVAKVVNAKVVYTPSLNYSGEDSFSYSVKDNEEAVSNRAEVKITITPINDAPVAVDDNITTKEKTPIGIQPLLNDYDLDGNDSKLKIISISKPKFGIAKLDNSYIYYTSSSKNATFDSITYTIADEYNATSTATINIKILPKNDAPAAFNKTVETIEERSISFKLNGTDPDGDDINYTLVYTKYVPEHGKFTGTAPNIIYTPNANYSGEDYIVFRVNDGKLESSVAVVKIIVRPLNDPPVAIAGDDVVAKRGDTIVLDGSKSYDTDGNITSYEWKEGDVTLSKDKNFSKIFYDEGVHRVTLIVVDDKNATDSDEKIITIKPCCKGCVYPDPTQTNPYK